MDTAKYIAKIMKRPFMFDSIDFSTTSWLNMGKSSSEKGTLFFPGTYHAKIAIVDPELTYAFLPDLTLGGNADIFVRVLPPRTGN